MDRIKWAATGGLALLCLMWVAIWLDVEFEHVFGLAMSGIALILLEVGRD